MELIHRTAVIDEAVSLASDVRVGPYAVISGPVRIERGCFVSSHAVIMGPVVIGVRNPRRSFMDKPGRPNFNPLRREQVVPFFRLAKPAHTH
jgi:UDP-N-acetylglucosamine acyltransferase